MISVEAFDVETDGRDVGYGLQPCRATLAEKIRCGAAQAWLTSAAWTAAGDETAVFMPTREHLKAKLDEWAASGVYVVGWNTPFDVAWLIAYGLREEVYRVRWLDAMLLYRHLTNFPQWHYDALPSYGLKAAVEEHLPDYADYSKDVQFSAPSQDDMQAWLDWRDKLTIYNKLDARLTKILAEKFLREMPPDMLRNALIEAACIPMVAETTVLGISADADRAQALSNKLSDDAKLAYMELLVRSEGANVSETVLASSQQLAHLLFVEWGLPVQMLTPTGKASTDKNALARLALHDLRAQSVHNYREANNNRTKFAEGVAGSLAYNGDGVVRPAARIFGTYTGRMTYSSKVGRNKSERPAGIALHQWKRDPEFRKLIRAPEGYTLLEFDFAGQEYRWMAVESGDPVMLGLCAPGEDAHAYMGARIARTNYHQTMELVRSGDTAAKRSRQLGKVANLSLQYRTSAGKLQEVSEVQHRLPMTLGEARAISSTYRQTYSEVPRYWERQIFKAKTGGVISTLAGRTVQLGTGDTWQSDYSWSLASTSINFPIQGAGADQKYLALAVLRDYLPKVDGRLYFELHDGLFIVVPDRYAQRAAKEVKYLLSNLPYKKAWGVILPVQFPVDAKLGPSWGELKEWIE